MFICLRRKIHGFGIVLIICILLMAATPLSANPDLQDEGAYNERGLELFGKEQFEQAISEFTKAIAINPSSEYAYKTVGLCIISKNNLI